GKRRIVYPGDDCRLHVLQPLETVERRIGLDRDQSDVRVEFTKTTSRANERSARAETGDEMREATASLLDDLWRRGVVVREPVAGIVVLVRVEVQVRIGGVQLLH